MLLVNAVQNHPNSLFALPLVVGLQKPNGSNFVIYPFSLLNFLLNFEHLLHFIKIFLESFGIGLELANISLG